MADKKKLVKKITMSKDTRLKLAIDDSRMMCGRMRNSTYTIRSISSKYPNFINKKFNIKKPGDFIDLESLGGTEREKIRRYFNHLAYNKTFHLTTKLFKHAFVMA